MQSVEEPTVKTAPAVDDSSLLRSQWIPTRGRARSPPLKRVIVYNREDKSMQVQPEDSLDVSDPKACKKIRLPRRQSVVAIFVDPETESEPTTENMDPEGYSNLLLAKLHLDRLGTLNRILRYFSLISSIYVINAPPRGSESSPPTMDTPRIDGPTT